MVLLGATGSIGRQTIDVVTRHPDRFRIVGLAAGRDVAGLVAAADRLGVPRVAVGETTAARALASARHDLEVLDGPAGVAALAAMDADVVVNGITGAIGLEPTLAALAAGTPVALANKESLIVGGDLVVRAADAAGGRSSHLLPVDSEHSGLAQCLRAGDAGEVAKLVLTASGGPFRGRSRAELVDVTPAEALAHPTWEMGPVISVNSATLMNKGLELIEAHELFGTDWDRLEVVVHPESVVHAMVEFVDGSTVAQLSPPDMRLPIQLALAWPERLADAVVRCDWSRAGALSFEPADTTVFRALGLAEHAGRRRGCYPAVLNGANEVAVTAFLDARLGFLDLDAVVEQVLERFEATDPSPPRELADVLAADRWARQQAAELVRGRSRG